MNVESILKTKGRAVYSVSPGELVSEAVRILKDHKIGALVVSTHGDTVQGIISERDITHGLADHGAAVMDLAVEDLMTREVETCGLADKVPDLMGLMTAGRFRHMPVVEDGRLCGVVSIGDVVKHRLDEITREADALRDYITQG